MVTSKNRGEALMTVVAVVALLGGVVLGGWKPLEFLRKKPPTEQVSQAQRDLDSARAELARIQREQEDAKAAERAKQEDQVRYAQQMQAGAQESLDRQPDEHKTAQTRLASSLLKRSELALGLAIGGLPADKQAEIVRIVDGALSSVQKERDEAISRLQEIDRELKTVTQERNSAKKQLETIAPKLEEAQIAANERAELLKEKTQKLSDYAQKLDAKVRESGSLGAQLDNVLRIAIWIACGYAFLVYLLPGILKHMEAGRAKNFLRDVSGYATNPLLYHDARKKIAALQDDALSNNGT